MVRVGNNRPDLGVNPICNRFTGVIEEGRPLFLPCNPPMPGAFVSIHFEGNVNISYIVVWAKSSDFSRPRQAPATRQFARCQEKPDEFSQQFINV